MDHWQPLEIIGLIAVGGFVLVGLGWAAVWYILRTRQLELSDLGAEERAARLLGRSLAGQWMSASGVQAVMEAFNRVPPSERIPLALAVHGLISASDNLLERITLEKKVIALVGTFNRRAEGGNDEGPRREHDGSSQSVKPA
jgi:hypothetical protein